MWSSANIDGNRERERKENHIGAKQLSNTFSTVVSFFVFNLLHLTTSNPCKWSTFRSHYILEMVLLWIVTVDDVDVVIVFVVVNVYSLRLLSWWAHKLHTWFQWLLKRSEKKNLMNRFFNFTVKHKGARSLLFCTQCTYFVCVCWFSSFSSFTFCTRFIEWSHIEIVF